MSLLHDIGAKYHTDKAIGHYFMDFYSSFFEPIRFEVKKVLEIGVASGASIRTWIEYFPNATVYGLDCGYHQGEIYTNPPERFVYLVDEGGMRNPNIWGKLPDNSFDIILDDGSHLMTDQQEAIKRYWSKVKPGGYFVMEDMHTSFWNKPSVTPYLSFIDKLPTTYDFLVNNVDTDDGELNDIRQHFKEKHLYHQPPNQFDWDAHITMVIKK